MQPHSTRKMATRKPENIHESDRDFAGPLGEINPDIPYPCEQGISGPERAVLLFLPLFLYKENHRQWGGDLGKH